MSTVRHRRCSAGFKARVALEAIRGEHAQSAGELPPEEGKVLMEMLPCPAKHNQGNTA